MEEQQEDEN